VTSAVLALAPFVAGDLIEPAGIVVDSFSGLSGAGRQYLPNRSNLFIDIDSNLRAYSPGSHRHNPEIDMALSDFSGKPWKVTFVPHLAPMIRGILTTIYVRPRAGSFSSGEAFEVLRSFYRDREASFVRVLNKVEEVAVSNVERSNYCDLAAEYVARTGQLVIASALDNLVKGAAGQAVQNMNILFGLDETAGLKGRSL
jgi:N-acetyl-gamma-glutamyl-phosphate reductase